MPLRIVVPASSRYDDEINEFIDHDEEVVILEHSLWSMARWEAETKTAFLSASLDQKDFELYIQCMSETHLSDRTCRYLSTKHRQQIVEYMFDDRRASKRKPGTKSAKVTEQKPTKKNFTPTEEFYYVMFERGLPLACEKWHFSRLMSLLETYRSHEKKSKGRKGRSRMSSADIARMSSINRSRQNGN